MRLATWFAANAGIAALAVDGPLHGDRAVVGIGPLTYQNRAALEGAVKVHERMRRDWLDTLAAVACSGWIDGQNVAFLACPREPGMDSRSASASLPGCGGR